MTTVLAVDLGTGGAKVSVWRDDAVCLAETAESYSTYHPAPGRDEQRPEDWWDAVVKATERLRVGDAGLLAAVDGIAVSGHSLGIVQLGRGGELLVDSVPIWSDSRGEAALSILFKGPLDELEWYRRTGGGFGAAHYPVTKALVLRAEDPARWDATQWLVGTKDWLNFRLTGELATDHSYASGSGFYDLATQATDADLARRANIAVEVLPDIHESHDEIGVLLAEPAAQLGVRVNTPVFAGAVDNACMALGSMGSEAGGVYAALGSSSWITLTSTEPLIDDVARPYVFRHAVPGHFISALSTFSSGTSVEWLRQIVAPSMSTMEFVDASLSADIGAGGVMLLPFLAGGSPHEGGPRTLGSLRGLSLATTSKDLGRAALEGNALALARSLGLLQRLAPVVGDLLISGGGARNADWNQIYADVFGRRLVASGITQQAAALGAAAIAFVGLGVWRYADADRAHRDLSFVSPGKNADRYAAIAARFNRLVEQDIKETGGM